MALTSLAIQREPRCVAKHSGDRAWLIEHRKKIPPMPSAYRRWRTKTERSGQLSFHWFIHRASSAILFHLTVADLTRVARDRAMTDLNPLRRWTNTPYPQALVPLFGEGNQLLIVNYPSHVGMTILHHARPLSTTDSGLVRTVFSGDGSTIRTGPTQFVIPTPVFDRAIDWLTDQGIHQNVGAGAC